MRLWLACPYEVVRLLFTYDISSARASPPAAAGGVTPTLPKGTPPPYSTVTDFARLRGWSTSLPMKTAV